MFCAVGDASGGSVFFVHPRDYAKSALGMQAELLAEICNLHGDGYACGVVNCTGAQIPRIEMSADDNDLLGMLGTFEVGNHVVTLRVGKSLRRENQVHCDAALL